MSKNRILALDLGATTGWAAIIDGVPTYWGQVKFKGERQERLGGFQDWLNKFLTKQRYDVVTYERPFTRGLAATRSLWGMAGVVDASVRRSAILDIVPSTLKKWATGSGKASKEEMIEAAGLLTAERSLHRMSRSLREHEADAIILGLYIYQNMEISP